MHQASLRHDCRQSGDRLHTMVYRTGSTQIDFLNLYSAWQTSNIRKLTTSIGGRTLSSSCANVAALKCHAYPVLRREKVKCTNHAWHSCLSRAISLHAKGNVFRRMCRCNFLDTQWPWRRTHFQIVSASCCTPSQQAPAHLSQQRMPSFGHPCYTSSPSLCCHTLDHSSQIKMVCHLISGKHWAVRRRRRTTILVQDKQPLSQPPKVGNRRSFIWVSLSRPLQDMEEGHNQAKTLP